MITVKILDTPDLIDNACALLYDEYIIVAKWKFLDDNPSGLKIITRNGRHLLTDRITEHAVWFGAFYGTKLVGCIRVLEATNNVPFEIELYPSAKDTVQEYIEPNKPNLYEGTRACVASEHKGKGILNKLYAAILEYAQNSKASIFGSASSGYIKSVLRRLEWPCIKEDAFKFEESDTAPVNFYLADYKTGQIAHIIEKINLLAKTQKKKTINIFDALEVVAPIFPAPLYWHNMDGLVLGANMRCLNAMGKSKEIVIGKTPYDFYPKDTADHIWKHSNYVITSGETLFQEEYTYNMSGECIGTYLAIKSPLYDDDDNVIGLLGTSVDITAQKEANRLRIENESNKKIIEEQDIFRQKADEMVHDIRSPIASIMMMAMYSTELSEGDRDMLRTASTRMQDIANDLLRDYTPHTDNLHEFAQSTLAYTVLSDILSQKRSEYAQTPIKFSINSDFDSSFAFININRGDFSRAISNLINNAVDSFSDKENCTVLLNLDSNENDVIITIEDNGNGMPEEIVNKLLNRIQVTYGKANGHGIGFGQIFGTIDSANGTLNIKSKEGHGTSVILRFPRIAAPAWIAEKILLNRDDIIMIIDDDSSIHSAWDSKFKVILKQAPYIQVEHFTNIEKALNFISNLSELGKDKVLLLSDYEFIKKPKLNGLQFIEQSGIKRSLLVTSHYGTDKIRNAAIKAQTKILPKTLAPMVLISFNDAEPHIKLKNVDLVLVDDDRNFVHEFISTVGKNKNIDKYYDPEDFLASVAQYPKHTRIYVDNILPSADIDGIDIAKNLHEQGYTNIYVVSGKPLTRNIPSYIRVITKNELDQLV